MKISIQTTMIPAILMAGSFDLPAAAEMSGTQPANASKDEHATSMPRSPAAPQPNPRALPAWLSIDWSPLDILEERLDSLAERGIEFHLFLNDQYQTILKGGAETNGSGRNAASLDAFVTFDLQTLGLPTNADALIHLQSNLGSGINPFAGSSFQINDDADGHDGFHVAQAWYRQHLADDRISLTVGYLDFQTIVDRNAYANSEDKAFMHQFLDNNPLVPLGIGLGVSLTVQPSDYYSMILGLSDAQSRLYKPGFSSAFHDDNWWLGYMEHGFSVKLPSSRGPLAGNYRFGLVFDPRPRDLFPRRNRRPNRRHADFGFYLNVDQVILQERGDANQGLGVFGRVGWHRPDTFQWDQFWSAGLSYTGLMPKRDRDTLGIAFATIRESDVFRKRVNRAFDSETVWELYYQIHVSDHLAISPDVQYIDDPGGAGEVGHALAAGVRFRISL